MYVLLCGYVCIFVYVMRSVICALGSTNSTPLIHRKEFRGGIYQAPHIETLAETVVFEIFQDHLVAFCSIRYYFF